MRFVCLLISFSVLSFSLSAQRKRDLLVQAADQAAIASSLSPENFQSKIPAYTNRAFWDGLDPVYRKALIEAGESVIDYRWKTVPATAYLEYVKTGNRVVMESVYNENLNAFRKLVFAELAEGKRRFILPMINGVWAISEITSWSASASINLQKKGAGLPDKDEPILELVAGITGNDMAWTYFLFHKEFDKESPLISARLYDEIQRRVLQPYYTRTDFWWMALDGKDRMVNNWNVWLNYNALTCMMLVEKDRQKQIEGVYKTMRSVDQFINYYKDDGGCEEGPAYWSHAGGMLYNYLDLLRSCTNGRVNIFDHPLVKNIGAYIAKAYIADDYYLNYADAAARLHPDAALVYLYGDAIHDNTLKQFGGFLAQQAGWDKKVPTENLYAGLRNLQLSKTLLAQEALQPLLGEAWMEGTGIAMARDQEGSTDGFYFSALAGHNEESHNHNDVGTCVLYYNGLPMLIDVGSETYTRQTFGPERYSIWTMRSVYHNVPLINGVEQKNGRQYEATNTRFSSNGKLVSFSTDIAKAYPADAAVKSWVRSYELKKGKSFVIRDNYQLSSANGQTALHFMTSAAVSKLKDGLLELHQEETRLYFHYNPQQLELEIEEVPVTDKRLLQSWPPVLRRLKFHVKGTATSGRLQLQLTPTQKP